MKITQEHMNILKERITPLDTAQVRQVYRDGLFPRASAVRDLDRRYRWDLFYAAKCHEVTSDTDYNMDHIYTALRRIVPNL